MLEASLFGPLRVTVDGRPLPELGGLRPRTLLGWLLYHPGLHARERVASVFWPNVLDASARASLRSAVWTIRTALDTIGAGAYVAGDRDRIGIAPGLERMVDTERFSELAGTSDPVLLEQAFALARAPFLSDTVDEWVLEARDAIGETAVMIGLRLADLAQTAGETRRSIEWTRRALRHARVNEATHRILIQRLADAGERAEALQAYKRLAALVAAEYGVALSDETRALAAELRRDGPEPLDVGPPLRRARVSEPPRLIGRERELDQLRLAWRAAINGDGQVVVIEAEPGLGKTRLAEALAEEVTAAGGVAVWGHTIDIEGAPPLAVFAEALAGLIRAQPPPANAAFAASLAQLVPAAAEAAGVAPAAAATPELARARLFDAVAEAFAFASARSPLLLVLEDLHAVDAASAALLAFLTHRLATSRMLIVATRRGEQASTDAASPPLPVAARVQTLTLRRLDPDEISQLIAGVAPHLADEHRQRAVAAAQGNPLLARLVAQAVAAGGDASLGVRAWIRPPLARLEASARLLVDVVSAAGRPLSLGEAAALVGAQELDPALAGAVTAGLLDAPEDGTVRFRHAVIREAAYAELGAARRAWVHGRLASVLAARRRRVLAELGRHCLLAGEDQKARDYLVSAASAAQAIGALDDASGFLRDAITLAGDGSRLQADLWLALADVESWRGQRDAYDAAFSAAETLLRQDADLGALAAAYAVHGRCLRTTLCYPRESKAAYQQAMAYAARAEHDLPELELLARAGSAWGEATFGDPQRAEALIDSVIGLASDTLDPTLACELALDRAAAYARSGRFADAEAAALTALGPAHDARRIDLVHVASLYAACAAAARGHFDDSIRHATDALAAGRSGLALEAQLVVASAYALARLGRGAEALQRAHDAARLLASTGDEALSALSRYDLGMVEFATGAAAAAVGHLEAALAASQSRVPRASARLVLAEARLQAGDASGAQAELDQFPFDPVAAADATQTLVARLERVQGLLAASRGDHAAAVTLLDRSIATWRRLAGRADDADPFAAALLDLGRPPVAGLIEPRLELGRVLADQAIALQSSGRVEQAVAAATEALAIASAVGYDAYRARLQAVATITTTRA